MWLNCVLALLILTVSCVSITGAQQLDSGAQVNLRKLDKPDMVKAYNDLSAAAIRAFMVHLTDPSDTEALEKLVMMSNDYIAKYPTSERVSEVNYYLGKALVQLGRVEIGIATLEKLVKNTSPDHIAVTQYLDGMWDKLRWSPLERGLLELGLAYDKQNQYDRADAVYKKLITYPDFVDGVQAQIARQILETDTVLRIGEVPKVHDAWIDQQAPIFVLEDGKSKWHALHHYWGQVVLLYFGVSDKPILKQVHEKYKNQRLQIFNVNVDPSDPFGLDVVDGEETAWFYTQVSAAKLVDMYQVRALPTVFLIDSEGVIRKTHLNGAALEKAVDELVKENLAKYDDPRTQEIVAKAVEAHGGLGKLQAVENIVIDFSLFYHRPNGTVGEEQTGKAIFYRNKQFLHIISETGEQVTSIYDGTSVYQSEENGNIVDIDDQSAEDIIPMIKDRLFMVPIWLLTTLAQNEIPIEYLGTKNVKSEPTSVLRVKQPSGKPLKIFISQKTHYLLQLEFGIAVGPIYAVLSFEQYKDVDGIKMSHYWIDKHHGHNETFLNKISLNVEIDPRLFDPNLGGNKEANLPNVKSDKIASDIIKMMVKAHGGLERLISIKNMVRNYQLFQRRADGPLENYGSGKAYFTSEKYRSEFHSVDGKNYTMSSDGKIIYFRDGNTFAKLADDEAKMQMKRDRDMAFREPVWLLKTLAENKTPVEYVGIENVRDDLASVLRVKQPSGIPIKIYISEKTNYLVKIVVEDETEKTVKLFREFKDVEGIMLPHQSITRTEDLHHETHFSNVIINTEIDSKLFNPKESGK